MAEPKQHSPSLLQMLVITLPIIAVMVFLLIAFNTGDVLWFWPVFDEIPISMKVYCYGQQTAILAGDAAFESVNAVVNQVLSGTKRWDQLTLSDVTYQEYLTSDRVVMLELYYDPPVRIHSIYKFFKNLDTIIIPLVGRHAQYNSVFGKLGQYFSTGSFHMNSMAPIVDAIQTQGLCQLP